MTATLCAEVYERILPGVKAPAYVLCTYIKDHSARHSWETLRVVDEADAESARRDVADAMEAENVPRDVKAIVRDLTSGAYDAYLELILNAAHNRKRARRGVLGFTRR